MSEAWSTKSEMPPILNGDRPLPHNKEAEVAVLGAMLLDPDNAVDVAVSRLNHESSFYNPAHQLIFDCLAKLYNEKPRGSIDLITLCDALEKQDALERIGGRAYLTRLLNSVPTAANIEHYADIVHQNSVLRRLIKTGVSVVDRCYDPGQEVAELLDTIEKEILEVTNLQVDGGAVSVGERVLDAINHIEKLHAGDAEAMGLATGYPDLDRLITGLKPAEMYVLAARPSIGKTALALNIMSNVGLSNGGTPVGFFSLEMSTDLLVLRLLCSLARVNLGDIRDGALSSARWQQIMEAGQALRRAPLYIDDTSGLDVMELRARGRRMKKEHDIKLLMIDYLQLLKGSGGRNSTRENDVAQMSGGIKGLAKELNIPIIVLAQLNRQAEQAGQKPKIGHLRESGAIEQDADVVALLHRERPTDSGNMAGQNDGIESELIIAKHRNGACGIVPMMFMPAYTRFESRSNISDDDVPDV
jgi:replicative DNA helicase